MLHNICTYAIKLRKYLQMYKQEFRYSIYTTGHSHHGTKLLKLPDKQYTLHVISAIL